MTLIYQSADPAAACHALVIGVGAYPKAKPAYRKAKTRKALRNVRDLPSAAAGARIFSDWLIADARLTAPLASVELLANGPDEGDDRYPWPVAAAGQGVDPRADEAVEEPTTTAVKDAGVRWGDRLAAQPNSIGLLYICGHGVILSSHPLVLLADLNADQANPWGAFLDLFDTASGLKQLPNLKAAHLFVDACGEVIPEMETQNPGVGAKFLDVDPYGLGVEKVSMVAAAAPNRLAYEDQPKTGGRFTVTLLRALKGAAARMIGGDNAWAAYPHGLHEDLKSLYRLEPAWRRQPLEPAPPILPSEALPIVTYSAPPQILIRVKLDPEAAINAADVMVLDYMKSRPPPLHQRVNDGKMEWLLSMQASIFPHYLRAEFPEGAGYANAEHVFSPTRSVLDPPLSVKL
jgi:hypothetical protein